MNPLELTRFSLDALRSEGAQKAQAVLTHSDKQELNVESGELSLLRTTQNRDLRLTAICDQRRGSQTLNRIGKADIRRAARGVLEIARASSRDKAYDVSEKQAPGQFDNGLEAPDRELMYRRLASFLEVTRKRYPRIVFENLILDFTRSTRWFLNSNGVEFVVSQGLYNFMAMFSAREGARSSSFNYTQVALKSLDSELQDVGSLNTLLRESSEQLETHPVREKFVGDILVTPDCLDSFLSVLEDWVSDGSLIAGTSVYRDKLGSLVADPRFSWHSRPLSEEIVAGCPITGDGYRAGNLTVIERGVLKTFLLGLYGSRKTGLPRSSSQGGYQVVDAGTTPQAEMIRGMKRGILLSRFSGGRPAENGDFSGVAKNSYYIENGKIAFPLSETMISGNIVKMFAQMKDISRERINFGHALFPWISFSGITVSGGG